MDSIERDSKFVGVTRIIHNIIDVVTDTYYYYCMVFSSLTRDKDSGGSTGIYRDNLHITIVDVEQETTSDAIGEHANCWSTRVVDRLVCPASERR